MKRTIKKVVFMFSIICACLSFSACGTVNEVQDSKESEAGIGEEVVLESESMEDNSHTDKEVEANSYYLLSEEVVECDFTKYGQMKTVHEEFKAEDGSDTYYYAQSGKEGPHLIHKKIFEAHFDYISKHS